MFSYSFLCHKVIEKKEEVDVPFHDSAITPDLTEKKKAGPMDQCKNETKQRNETTKLKLSVLNSNLNSSSKFYKIICLSLS